MLDSLKKKKMLEQLTSPVSKGDEWKNAEDAMAETTMYKDGRFQASPYSESEAMTKLAAPQKYGQGAKIPGRGTSNPKGEISSHSSSKNAPILPVIREEMKKEFGSPDNMMEEYFKRQVDDRTEEEMENERKKKLSNLFRQA